MVIHLLDEMRFNRKTSQQYIITYETKETIKEISKLGSITYKSPVLNVLFIDTYKSKNELLKIEGVMSVTVPTKGKLLNNKERY
ncbi:hypothetical protein FJQ98_16075 [Lysinibacillus agricola]|uniref:Uncharacterized protein n=1 Tax=Lysinibacillus agricola TaxID=2590012 RepID=A0ABX7ALJ5_9BACI|nr:MULTISPECIES: hypothetical protein [Lysinibacillus]KOS61540.1 hypothetical protein AN161_18295 [Lysinibacillus sp. FJAT-14222]QQP10763.1 hypothetical protein FJQ98_16075 [Lysinibacillus agricola]